MLRDEEMNGRYCGGAIADRTVFARELFSRFSLVKISLPACTASESRALPLRWFQSGTTSGHPNPNSNRNLSASVSLTAIAQANWEEVLS